MRFYAFKITIFLFFVTILTSCGTSPYYQKQQGIPGAAWSRDFQPEFEIIIPDSSYQYITYIIVRHGADYPFSNLWVDMSIKNPGSNKFETGRKLEIPLADVTGKWLAKGHSDIWEHRIPIHSKSAPDFLKAGTYTIKLKQIMRQDPLPAVINMGIRVERVHKNISAPTTTDTISTQSE
jgi:gliding motility-associated lipoprotein GldH